LSSELARCSETFGWDWSDLKWLTINAMKSAFWPFDDRLGLIDRVIKPAYSELV
jgi:adenosine deaminase